MAVTSIEMNGIVEIIYHSVRRKLVYSLYQAVVPHVRLTVWAGGDAGPTRRIDFCPEFYAIYHVITIELQGVKCTKYQKHSS